MKERKTCMQLTLVAITLAWSLGGCAGNAPMLERTDQIDQKRLQMEWVPEPSGESTNWGIWVDMQGGG